MYNGIGINVSGFKNNGYVQRDFQHLLHVKERVDYNPDRTVNGESSATEADVSLLPSERTYKIELKCMELRELMEEQGYTPEQIEAKIATFRTTLLQKEAVMAAAERSAVYFNTSGLQIDPAEEADLNRANNNLSEADLKDREDAGPEKKKKKSKKRKESGEKKKKKKHRKHRSSNRVLTNSALMNKCDEAVEVVEEDKTKVQVENEQDSKHHRRHRHRRHHRHHRSHHKRSASRQDHRPREQEVDVMLGVDAPERQELTLRQAQKPREPRRARSRSIRKRRGSPSHLERRRITSARKRPVPYYRPSPPTPSSCSSCYGSRSRSRTATPSPLRRIRSPYKRKD